MNDKDSMNLLSFLENDDFDSWSYEEEDYLYETEEFNEDETEYYFGNNVFFCPHCQVEYAKYEDSEKCFKDCEKVRVNVSSISN